MRFAVGFDLRLPHNLMEPILRELSPNEDCLGRHRTSKIRVSMVRNYYHFNDLVVVSSSNLIVDELWVMKFGVGWLERTLFTFCKTLKGINQTKANDAGVTFQRITLLLVSQATSKGRWHKYISLTKTTSVRCVQIYFIQLYFASLSWSLLFRGMPVAVPR